MLTKAQAGGHAAAAIILRQCEDFLQTGEIASLLTDELKDAMAESQLRPDLTRSPLFPFVADRPRARNGAWYEMVPRSQGRIAGPARHLQGLHRPPARHRGDGFRRGLSHADPPDRPYQPQGPQQCGDRGRGRSRQPLRHRVSRRRPRRGASGTRHAARISAISSRPARSTTWRSRSTSPCNARPIIPGSSSIRNGSSGGPTARCATRKIRPRNTRTSSIRISRRRMPARCGRRCATWCCSGSTRA